MKKFQLKRKNTGEIIGDKPFDTKVDAIEAMNEYIDEHNEEDEVTEEDGLSPFDFEVEKVDVEASSIGSFEEARKYLGGFPNADYTVTKKVISGNCLNLEDVTLLVQELNPHHVKALIALNKLFTIAEAWNKEDGFVPDFSNIKQWKYFPWFKYSDQTAGFVCAGTYNAASTAYAYFGYRLCFKSASRAKEFGVQFADLYNEVFLFND